MNRARVLAGSVLVFLAITLPGPGAPPSFDDLMSDGLVSRNDDQFTKGIQGGASITARGKFGETLLMKAVTYNLFRSATLLLEKGADVNAANDYGATALFITLHPGGDTRMCALLLQHGADVNHADKGGEIPLVLAAGANSPAIIHLLIQAGAAVDSTDKFKLTPLIFAAGAGQGDAVRALLAAGASVKSRDVNGETALANALVAQHVEVANLLLKAGASPDETLPSGAPLILECLQQHRRQSLAALVSAKANVNFVYGNMTPLMWALDDRDCLSILLSAKPDLNRKVRRYFISSGPSLPTEPSRNYDERTALMMAVENNRPEAVKILLAAGANPKIKDDSGHTALDLARQQGHPEIVRLLE